MGAALRVACLGLVSCVIVPAAPPPSPSLQQQRQQQQQQPPRVQGPAPAPAAMIAASSARDCPIDQRAIALGPDRVLHCRGIPFTVEFPAGASVQQEKVGPGTSFLANMNPGIVILGTRPATFEPLVFREPRAGLDRSLDLILGLLAQYHPRVERRYDVALAGAVQGRGLEFSYPLDGKLVAGTVHAFLARGWIGILVAGGPSDSVVHRGTAAANRFLGSLRVVPVGPEPYVATLETGAHLTLPADAWLNSDDRSKRAQGVVRERLFALPDRDALLGLQEQELGRRRCADLMSEQSSRAFLDEHLRSTAEVQFQTLRRVRVAGTTALYVEAGVRTGRDARASTPHYPASALLFCKEPTFVLGMIMGHRPHAEMRETLEGVFGTFDR